MRVCVGAQERATEEARAGEPAGGEPVRDLGVGAGRRAGAVDSSD